MKDEIIQNVTWEEGYCWKLSRMLMSLPVQPPHFFLLRFKGLSGRREERPLGIKVTAVAPGAFRTDFLSAHSIRKSDTEDSAYAASVGRSSAVFDAMAGKQIGDPDRAALAILAAVRGTTRRSTCCWERMRCAAPGRNSMPSSTRSTGSEDVTSSTDFPDNSLPNCKMVAIG